MPLPAIRMVDVTPVQHEGETMLCLHDPQGFVDTQILLSPAAFFVATLLNGESEVEDIQAEFARQSGGRALDEQSIQEVVDYLDECGFLASPRFEALFEQLVEEYAASGKRPAYLAGKSYAAEPGALRSYLDGLFTRDGAPGKPPSEMERTLAPPAGIICPHIDFERGGACYAHAYSRLAQGTPPETVFIFGTAHHGPPVPFILTRKDFDTPFGAVETDVDAVERMAAACDYDPFEYELFHRSEHSIEFQAVMLKYLFDSGVHIVPVLCGAFLSNDLIPEDPADLKQVNAVLDVCRDIIREKGGRACIIAGADLAHVGKRFGDDFDISGAIVQAVEDRDMEDMAFAKTVDAAGWYRSVMKDLNERRVCGLNSIYCMLKSLEGQDKQGELVHYGYAPDPAGGIVSFANVVID